MAASRIGQPAAHGRTSGSTDQRKVYTDWANNRLRKAGLSDWLITDLQKDVPDGSHLPRIIKAVVLDDVPKLVQNPSSDADKRHNIDACIKFLQSRGINSSSYSSKDIADGSMRAILMMFFSLSQYRPKAADNDAIPAPSRISRPTSPSLRTVHGISPSGHTPSSTGTHSGSQLTHSYPGTSTNSTSGLSRIAAQTHRTSSSSPAPPVLAVSTSSTTATSNTNSSSSSSSSTAAPTSVSVSSTPTPSSVSTSSVPSSSTSSTPCTSPTTSTTTTLTGQQPTSSSSIQPPAGGSTSLRHRPSMGRRFGGSTIPTGMDPLGGQQRRVPYRPIVVAAEKDKDGSSTDDEDAEKEKSHKMERDSNSLPAPHSGLKLPSTSTSSSPAQSPLPSPSEINSKTEVEPVRQSSQPSLSSHPSANGKDSLSRLKPSGRSNSLSGLRSGLAQPQSRLQKMGESKSFSTSGETKSTPAGGQDSDTASVKNNTPEPSNKVVPSASNSTSEEEHKQTSTPGLKKPSGLTKMAGTGLRQPQSSSISPSPLLKTASPSVDSDEKSRGVSRLPSSKLHQPLSSSGTKLPSSDQSNSDVSEGSAVPKPGFVKTKLAPPSGSKLSFSLKQPNKTTSPLPSPSTSNTPSLTSPPSELDSNSLSRSPHSSKTSLLSSSESLEGVKSPTIPPPKGFEKAAPQNGKSNIPPPLNISGTVPPTPADTLGSTSSISSTNSQSESNTAEVLTPSPSSGRKYCRRTSPEGMSVDETASPRECKDTHLSSGDDDMMVTKEAFASGKEALSEHGHITQIMTIAESRGRNTSIKQQPVVVTPSDKSMTMSPSQSPSKGGYVKRARSLSPKSSHRIRPILPPEGVSTYTGDTAADKSSDEEKPKLPRSALRTGKLPRGNFHVTISPHSSNESFSSSNASLTKLPAVSPLINVPVRRNEDSRKENTPERRVSQTERPKSMEALESHLFSQQAFPGDLHSNSALVRHGSTRSERLDYSEVADFLKPGRLQELAQARRENEKSDSTPELLETFENQLSTLRKDLEDKDRMLTMYETSMADLSTTLSTLKRSLEEKDAAIKHLTEERHRWHHDVSYDARSYAPSRLMAPDAGGLSDGALSDTGTMEPEGKETKKKSKKWKKFSLRRKKENEVNTNLDSISVAGSVVSTGGSKSLKRNNSRRPPDLVSISEYGSSEPSRPMRLDVDNKSMMYDLVSESGVLTPSGFLEEEPLSIYEEDGPGMRVLVQLVPSLDSSITEESEVITLGILKLAPETSWVSTDAKIATVFKYHISTIDPSGHLGLTEDSIHQYWFTDTCRISGNALLPLVTPYQAAASDHRVKIIMRGAAQESCDSLAYKALTSASMLESYIAMLQETQWLVVMGTKGTCKTTLASLLVSHLELLVSEGEPVEGGVLSFNLAAAGTGLDSTLRFLKDQLPRKIRLMEYAPIVFLDGVYDCSVLEQVFALAETFEKRPFIISTLNSGGGTRGSALHQLMFHHNIRVITCSPHSEPVAGMLTRSLRKKVYKLKGDSTIEVDSIVDRLLFWLPHLLEYLNFFIIKFHSNNVALGPRVFMNCPLESGSSEMEVWFINLWNHFIIPYLMGTIMAGIEAYSADPRLDWIDVREWVFETYPWQMQQIHSMHKLRTLNPDDVGWSHAVRPVQNRFMYMRDGGRLMDDDTQSVLGRIS